MKDDDHVCLCFGVSKRKIVNFCRREKPPVASVISDCLGAGTGCGWCVRFLEKLHAQVQADESEPDLPISPADYAAGRADYRKARAKKSG